MLLALAAGFLSLSGRENLQAAMISPGDVTTTLGPTFFVDDAATGGSDTSVPQTTGTGYNRIFAGLLNANQGPTRVTLTGFGFATTGTTASSLTVTFTYLGADEAVGGADDVAMGSATGTFTSTTVGAYVFAFDTPLTANLNITGRKFRIQVTPTGSSLVVKNASLPFENGATGPKFSVAGIATSQRLNLAKYQAVTTSSVNDQRLATYLTDGVAGNDNSWESAGAAPHWAQVTFPFPVAVGSAQVFSGVDDGGAMTDFKLQYLNNAIWVDVPGAVISGNTNVERNLVFTNTVTASAFRIYNSTDATIRIRELALYPPNSGSAYPIGTDLTVNLAHQRPALATANTTGNFALLAVDGRVNESSKWQTSTAGAQSLEIDLRVSTKIGSAHLYSGSVGVAALANFVLSYWDGVAWQPIPGGTVAGNTSAARAISFSSSITTTKVRLDFTNAGTTSVQELCIFPANTSGYPLGTGVIGAPPSAAKFTDYHDAFYNITNTTAGKFIAVSGGSPILNQAGLTTAQGQYQVLLNVDTGTYRLRNRATGNCLSGAQLSTTPGSLLVDAPYSALPDQDWILDRFDSTTFYLINQWSGLVIDTQGGGTAAGTPLVQNTNTGALSQRWQMAASTHFPKKGGGGTNFSTAFNSNWAYNWGQKTSNSLPTGAVYHPMQWGNFNWNIGDNAGPLWQYHPTWRTKGEALHLLGYNEPDKVGQANFSVETGITLWPRLLSMNAPLVSPAPASQNGGWLASFYTQANNLGYRVDYTAVHHYPGPNGGSATSLINDLQDANTTWGRTVWLTEFSFVNWSGTNTWTEEDNYNCLAEFLWRAESLTWLRKYGLFRFKEDAANPAPADPWSPVGPRSNAHDVNDKLTPFGELYSAWDGDATVKPNKVYHIHNKGTRKRLANTLVSTADAKSIRINDTSVQWTLVPSPTANQYYVTSTRDGRRLSSNGTSVTQAVASTTGTAVQWSLTEDVHGWFYLGHPSTAKRLQLAYNNGTSAATYTMAAAATTGDALLWRFIVTPPQNAWKGVTSTSWTTAGNWTPTAVPVAGDAVTFNSISTANLATVLNQNFNLWGITVTNPTGPVSIGGTHTLSIGGGGIDLSAASQDLTISAPMFVGALQSWNVAASRTLRLGGVISSIADIHISGAGKVMTTANNVLPNGTGSGNLILNGTLDLNGTSQVINSLSGSGIVDNSVAGAGVLTVFNGTLDNTTTFSGTLQNTVGTLALVKTGIGNLALTGTNTHSGGTTNNGSGGIYPKTDTAFGSGPVVMNAGTLYATGLNYTFTNPLTLNGGTVRVGGSNNSTIDWTGPVSVTADSGISSDDGTAGVTLSGNVNLQGAALNSSGSEQNTISGFISGNGSIRATGTNLTLTNTNNYSGGTINNGIGGIFPKTDGAFGSGPVVVNSGTVYATGGFYTFANPLTLNGGTLRVGGGTLSTIDWTGPVSVTADSGMIADGGTVGITLSGGLNMNDGDHTFTSYENGTANIISAPITGGSGTITVTLGTLHLNAANTFAGTFRLGGGSFSISNPNAFQNATLDMTADAGSVNLNNKWATIGALTGSRNLNLGSFSEVQISIGKNNLSTTYSGVLSNSGSLNILKKIGTGTLTLSGPNTYNSATQIIAGTLALGANDALPATAITIGDATLDAATFTDAVGTLDVTTLTSKINLGTGAALAFAPCNAVSWTGGKLNITGTFVPGVSLKFGTDATGLTSDQLLLISAPGFTTFSLTPAGFLTATALPNGYDTWKTQITNGLNGRTQDADGDGFTNLQEFLFGTSPIAGNGSLVSITPGNGNVVLRWLQRESGSTYSLKQSATLAVESWATVGSPSPAMDANQVGAPTDYDYYTVTLTTSNGRLFYRVQGVEN